jgi:hypothetical protein
MGGLESALLAGAAALAVVGVGIAAVFLAKGGITYMMAGGNPRRQAEAYGSLENVPKGLLLVLFAGGIAAFLGGLIKFG